jgi:hypothetical protein
MPSSGLLRFVALVRTDVSQESIASIIIRISLILFILNMETIRSSETLVLTKLHGVTSQRTALLLQKV